MNNTRTRHSYANLTQIMFRIQLTTLRITFLSKSCWQISAPAQNNGRRWTNKTIRNRCRPLFSASKANLDGIKKTIRNRPWMLWKSVIELIDRSCAFDGNVWTCSTYCCVSRNQYSFHETFFFETKPSWQPQGLATQQRQLTARRHKFKRMMHDKVTTRRFIVRQPNCTF